MWAAAFDTSLCALFCVCVCVFSFFFVFLPPSPRSARNTDCRPEKNANIVLVRSGMEIRDGLASVCTCECWQASRAAPGSRVELERPHLLPFQTATCSCRRTGPCLFLFITNDLSETQPQFSSLLAFKQEEITDDDIRVVKESERPPQEEEKETLDLFV